jgi:3-methyladenine DNA glycosylase/8-oxoguanine DNA glycosylase
VSRPSGDRSTVPVVEIREDVTPAFAWRLPGGSMDGVERRRGTVLLRLVHVGNEPVELRAAQPAPDHVVIAARSRDRTAAGVALGRWRASLGLDDDLSPFVARFRDDPLIGASVRRRPWLRVRRRPVAFEALAWAVTEQLIEYQRAVAIQRRIVRRWGREAPQWAFPGLRDLPSPAAVAALAPAELQACDLSAGRAVALIRVAREVAAGRIELDGEDVEPGWARLRAIPGVGEWTVEILALHGQGRLDQIPAGDLGYLKAVGRLLRQGDPHARAQELDVRAIFAAYDPWAGLAGHHLLMGTGAIPRPEGGRDAARRVAA